MADLMKVERKAIALNGYLNGVKDATAKFMDIINGVKFMYSESPDYPASDHTADVARSLSGLDVTALNKFADALRGMNDSAKAYVAGNNAADELHDKCQTCVNKVKYQDDVPCCDCDPAGKASGYEGSDSKRRKLYVVMVRKCDNDACVRTYMITGDNNSSEDEVYNRAISNKDLFKYITVHEVDTTSDDYRIIVEDKSTGEEK